MTKPSNACSTKSRLRATERAGWGALPPLVLPEKAVEAKAERDAAVAATEEAEVVEAVAEVAEEANSE